MRVIIIEDETPAANRLGKMLLGLQKDAEIVKKIDSVEGAVKFFHTSPAIDLVFMDIQLADGLSFDIFQQTQVVAPVIFTTAFDQYALKAFKVNSIDYLLKPIDEKELKKALEKYQQLFYRGEDDFSDKMLKMVKEMKTGKYRERLLIKRGQQLTSLKTEATAYCYADGKLCYAIDFNNNRYLLETTLTQLEEELQPQKFYRINRHLLVNIEAILKAHTWLGGRLKLELSPTINADTVISRERVSNFKEWFGGNH